MLHCIVDIVSIKDSFVLVCINENAASKFKHLLVCMVMRDVTRGMGSSMHEVWLKS